MGRQGMKYFNFDSRRLSPAVAEVNETMLFAPARAASMLAKQGWGKAGECLLRPRAGGAVAQVGPSSLCSTTDAPARHHTDTTQRKCCFLGAFPMLSGSPPPPAHTAGVGSGFDQGHSDCVGVFNFIVPTQWRKCNTDTACVLGVQSYTCASTLVLPQVTFQLVFFNPFLPF